MYHQEFITENRLLDPLQDYVIDGIDVNWLRWIGLCKNSSDVVVSLLLSDEMYTSRIAWNKFSENTNDMAVSYLLDHPHLINWDYFSINSNDMAVHHLLLNIHKIHWHNFNRNNNSRAVEYLLKNPSKIVPFAFSRNNHLDAVTYLLHTYEVKKLVSSMALCLNDNELAVKTCLQNDVNFQLLCGNSNDDATEFVLKYPDNIHLAGPFSSNANPKAVEFMLKCEASRLDWSKLSGVPTIFKKDTYILK